MHIGGSVRTGGSLVQIGSKDDSLAELERSYRAQIGQVIGEIDDLLPKCRRWMDEAAYVRNRAEYVAVVACFCNKQLRIDEFQALLGQLSALKQTFVAVLK